jgi:ligand-binding sensor domain-containing protein/DNA-binding CsgD family transcriptional regulator
MTLLTATLRLLPQSEPFHFVTIGREEGLSRNTVFSILQDRYGFMWFATESGLNRYDGNDFTVFRPVPGEPASLSHSYILSLYEDRKGVLWIGTFNGGLNRYDPAKGEFRRFRHDPGRADSLSCDTVGRILESRSGVLWIGTDKGLDRLDPVSGRVNRDPLDNDRPGSSNHVHDLFEDTSGALWIATFGGGLYRRDPRSGRTVRFRNDAADPASLSSDFTNAILEDRQGNLWVGTENGLNRLDRISGRFSRYSLAPAGEDAAMYNAVLSARRDRDGRLWFGTRKGLIRLEGDVGEQGRAPVIARSLSENQVFALWEDRSGILWVGTDEDGIKKFNPNQKKFLHFRCAPGDAGEKVRNQIFSFWQDPSRMLWIGTNEGLRRLDRTRKTCDRFPAVSGTGGGIGIGTIRRILPDGSGGLWLGSDGGGLIRFNPASGAIAVYRNQLGNPGSLSYDRIRTLYVDRTGRLWIGTFGGGVNLMERGGGTFKRFQFAENDAASLGDNTVRAIIEDRAGSMWFATNGGGLSRLDPGSDRFVRYRHDPADPSSLNNDFVFSLHEDRQGNLWIGTWGGGLNLMDRWRGTFRHYTMADGLASNDILGILEDRSGNLWLMTNEGLSRFTPATGQFRNYDVSDGLQDREFSACFQGPDGEMFFGGANGFNTFLPQEISDNGYVPPVRITSFKVLNKEVALPQPIWETKEVVISPQDHLFSFEFAALDYTAPQKNQYAYKLEGLTRNWIQTDARRRFASFSLLPPGRYVFRVKGSNSDGVWNEQEATLVIRVLRPWWRTWWFLSLLAAAVALASFELNRTRIRRRAKRVRTAEAMEQLFDRCTISPREREIALLLLKGLSNKEIGEKLFIELSTVKIHVHHVLRKLGVRNRTQLVRLFQNLQVK